MSEPKKFSRRFVLQAGAVSTVALATGGIRLEAYASDGKTESFAGWVDAHPDNTISILFPSTEMGQGSHTGLPQILADELDADWDQVNIVQLNEDDRKFGNPAFGMVLYTAGSSGVYGYFKVLREAGAHLRELLKQRAAVEWNVSASSISTANNRVMHEATGRSLTYGEIVGKPDFSSTTLEREVKLKDYDDFTLIGKSVPRRDIPDKSTGQAMYAIDVRVPDMLYATVLRAPVEGEEIATIDEQAARATPDVVGVVRLPDGVAVLAKTMHASFVGRAALEVTWTTNSPFRKFSSDTTLKAYSDIASSDRQGDAWREQGDIQKALGSADEVMEGLYTSDYAYHAQIEPMAAVASVDADGKGAEIWAGTQTQSWTTRTATEVLGTTQDRIKLNMMTMGGGFGRRTELMQNYVRDALVCSREMKKPVKVVWSRTDDLKHGAFRPAAAQHMTASLSESGEMTGWQHRVATPSVIAYFNPIRWNQVKPNDIIAMRGAENKFYDIPNFLAEHVITERHARVLPWRGIGAAYTSFGAEGFLDEVAEKSGKSPFEFRKHLLRNNKRSSALLDELKKMSDAIPMPEGRARGLAFAGYGDTPAAGMVEISLDRTSGQIDVHHAWIAVDAGLIISPDNSHNQIEGGVIWGISAALFEKVTIQNGVVDQENFYNYRVLRNNESAKVDVYLAKNGEKPTQIGEVGSPMVAPAIANAFYTLTGRRIRHMPFTPDKVLEVLA